MPMIFSPNPLENIETLYITIEKALDRRRLHKENKALIRALKQANSPTGNNG